MADIQFITEYIHKLWPVLSITFSCNFLLGKHLMTKTSHIPKHVNMLFTCNKNLALKESRGVIFLEKLWTLWNIVPNLQARSAFWWNSGITVMWVKNCSPVGSEAIPKQRSMHSLMNEGNNTWWRRSCSLGGNLLLFVSSFDIVPKHHQILMFPNSDKCYMLIIFTLDTFVGSSCTISRGRLFLPLSTFLNCLWFVV